MININVTNGRIVGSAGQEFFSVSYSEEKYKQMMDVKNAFDKAAVDGDVEGAIGILKTDFLPLTVETLQTQVASKSPYLSYNERTGTYHLTVNGKVSSVPMPTTLAEQLLEAAEKNLPVEPIIKFWTRLLRNPNIKDRKDADRWANSVVEYVSRTFVSPSLYDKYIEAGYSEEVARKMATVRQTPLTMEGLVCTKKVVTPLFDLSQYKYVLENGEKKKVLRDNVSQSINEDTGEVTTEIQFAEEYKFQPYVMGTGGDAFHLGTGGPLGHVIQVGKEMHLTDWKQVNCDFNSSCVKGIHTGNQDYIDGYENDHNMTLNCFVDPAEIGAVACGDDVLRVKSLFPHSIKDRENDNRNMYHSSSYAALKDKQWSEYLKEAVERFEEQKKALEEKLAAQQNDLDLTI